MGEQAPAARWRRLPPVLHRTTRAQPGDADSSLPCAAHLPPLLTLALRVADGGVAGTRKYSAHKAGGGLVAGAAAAAAAAAPLLGLDPWALLNIETGFALASSAALAGGWCEAAMA